MSTVHIFAADCQPAIRFVDSNVDPPEVFKYPGRALFFTNCCLRWRWAKYVQVQVYYDGHRHWCAPGHGCKSGAK